MESSPTAPEQEREVPCISLIIPSRNRPQLLLDTVESVLRGDEVPAELIVVDQSDAPHPTLKAFTTQRPCAVRYLWTRSVGASRAMNEGIAAATYDVVVLTDDDMLFAPSWLRELVAALVAVGPGAVVTGRVEPGEAMVNGSFTPSTKTADTREVHQGRIEQDVLYTGNMAMRRSVTADVGLFDERLGPGARFSNAQDNDFGFRLLEAGYRIVYEPAAVAYHRGWRGAGDYLPLQWSYGRGQGGYYAKHLSLRDRYMLGRMWKDMRQHIVQFVRAVLRHPHAAAGHLVYVGAVISGAAEWRLTRQSQQAEQ
jgi:GT2 family glycosyltransferase